MNNLFENWPQFDIGEGAFYAVFGFLFVFCGIILLILIFSLLGLIMKKINERPKKEKRQKNKIEAPVPQQSTQTEDGISPEVVAVIAAAISAYYEGSQQKCDFVVKRIKRL